MRVPVYIAAIAAALLFSLPASAQTDRAEVRRGNRQFKKEQYREADVSYRKALLKDSMSVAANYNLASNLYRQQNFDDAAEYVGKISEIAQTHPSGRDIHFNAGDIAIAKKDWQGAVDAFRKAILMDPEDLQAKENYIYAKKMLQNSQGGGGQNQDQNQQDQNQNQDQDQQDQNQNQQDQDQNQQDRQPQDSPKISEQQAQQMLKAIQAKEQQTQDKVNREKAEALKSKDRDKNW
ncbi:MAG: tetratricopeptide repeat protein [Candidatus Cryptobacteroides sp.]